MSWKVARWFVVAVGGALVVLAIAAGAGSRTEMLRNLVVDTLADRLESQVELSAFSVDTFPTVTARGDGLVVRHRGRTDVPPLVRIESFRIEGPIIGLLRRPRQFKSVDLTALQINIPPGGFDTTPRPSPGSEDGGFVKSPVIVQHLRADNAELRIIPAKQGKTPKVFAIHRLEMRSLGLTEKMPFSAELTNPIPKGMIETDGEFGPWQKDEPGATPLRGRYTFANADLSTIKGIGGILESTGEFSGELQRIAVNGETRTPDFRINVSNQPVPLTTRFEAVVDGTDGDTYLNHVYATFLKTSLHARGAVDGTTGVKGRTIRLHVKIDRGRIEDLLRLSIKSERPLMVGDIALHTDFRLPPGEADIVERLQLAGEFDVDGRFTDPEVQKKLTGMSQRAQGEDPEDGPDNVMSDLRGRFRMQNGRIAFSNLTFSVPGATVSLSGTYHLRTEQLAFDGTLRMKATISQAAGGGLKSVFLKVVDPLFRKGNAGTVLPIKIRGTRSNPEFGVDVFKALTPK